MNPAPIFATQGARFVKSVKGTAMRVNKKLRILTIPFVASALICVSAATSDAQSLPPQPSFPSSQAQKDAIPPNPTPLASPCPPDQLLPALTRGSLVTNDVPFFRSLGLQMTTHQAAATLLDFEPSRVNNYENIFDRQRAAPTLNGQYFDHSSATFIPFGPAISAFSNDGQLAAQVPGSVSLTTQGDGRADVIIDTAKLATPLMSANLAPGSFLPSLIPVRGDPFYGQGERASMTAGDTTGHIGFDLLGNTQATGTFRAMSDLTIYTQSNGQAGVQVLHAYGQAYGFIFGKTDSAFSDPNAYPNTVDVAGPNAEVYLQHPLIGYRFAIMRAPQSQLTAEISVEYPETSVTPLDTSMADQKDWNNRSRIPDFAGHIRFVSSEWGNVQIAGVLRDVGIENTAYKEALTPSLLIQPSPGTPTGLQLVPNTMAIAANHEDVFGWGIHFTGAANPFQGIDYLRYDLVRGGILYGQGVGNYVTDLRAIGGYDAMFNESGHLKAIPVLSYWGSYSHFWSQNLSSTMVFSEVNADTFLSPSFPTGMSQPYKEGQYASINLIYHSQTFATKKGGTNALASWFAGIEYLYGYKETLGGARGVDQRVDSTVGLKF
jgi:hypothetical protein